MHLSLKVVQMTGRQRQTICLYRHDCQRRIGRQQSLIAIASPCKPTSGQCQFFRRFHPARIQVGRQCCHHIAFGQIDITLSITLLPAVLQSFGQFLLSTIQGIQLISILVIGPCPLHFCRDFFFHHVTIAFSLADLRISQRILVERSQQRTDGLFYRQFIVISFGTVQLSPRVAERSTSSVPCLSFRGTCPLNLRFCHFQTWMVGHSCFDSLFQRYALLSLYGRYKGYKQSNYHSSFTQRQTVSSTQLSYGDTVHQPVENWNDNQSQYSRNNQSTNHYGSQRTLYLGTGRFRNSHRHKAQ